MHRHGSTASTWCRRSGIPAATGNGDFSRTNAQKPQFRSGTSKRTHQTPRTKPNEANPIFVLADFVTRCPASSSMTHNAPNRWLRFAKTHIRPPLHLDCGDPSPLCRFPSRFRLSKNNAPQTLSQPPTQAKQKISPSDTSNLDNHRLFSHRHAVVARGGPPRNPSAAALL